MDIGPVFHCQPGPLICRSALPAATCARWLAALADSSEAVDGAERSSAGRSQPLVALPQLRSSDVLGAVAASRLHAVIEARLGPAPRCNLSQSWLRHGRPPHHWHQDGALRFDFAARAGPLPADALLEMLTCWVALTPCGEHAPGLEWVASPTTHLLMPDELTDAAVRTAHDPARFERPHLQPGDAVVFDGTLLHRTHLTPQMTPRRSSLELRFFRAPPGLLPARLAADCFAVLPPG